jgi:hypothetical protein
VEPARRHDRGRAQRPRADRPRPRPGNRRGRSPARLRPLLPRARGSFRARLGPRAGDRPAGGRRARGHRERGERPGRRRALPRPSSASPYPVFRQLSGWSA